MVGGVPSDSEYSVYSVKERFFCLCNHKKASPEYWAPRLAEGAKQQFSGDYWNRNPTGKLQTSLARLCFCVYTSIVYTSAVQDMVTGL